MKTKKCMNNKKECGKWTSVREETIASVKGLIDEDLFNLPQYAFTRQALENLKERISALQKLSGNDG